MMMMIIIIHCYTPKICGKYNSYRDES